MTSSSSNTAAESMSRPSLANSRSSRFSCHALWIIRSRVEAAIYADALRFISIDAEDVAAGAIVPPSKIAPCVETTMRHEKLEFRAAAVSRNPATGRLIKTYPHLAPAEIEDALARNAAAAKVWRDTSMEERVRCYERLALTLRDQSDLLACRATTEMGKTIRSARMEIDKCIVLLQWLIAHGPSILADEVVEAEDPD